MFVEMRQKIRALVEDFEKPDFETFTYTISNIFTLAEPNINSITKVLKNGTTLGSGQYSYDSTTNKLTITISMIKEDKIEVDYTFNKYSDSELNEFIRASLVWLSIFAYSETDYEVEDEDIFPTPDNKTLDLIVLISSILINPDWSSYRLPTITVTYRDRLPKDQKIQKLISRFQRGLGVNDVLEF